MTLAPVLSPESSCKRAPPWRNSRRPPALPGLQAGSFICVHISLEPTWIARLSVTSSRRTWLLTLKSPGKIGFSGRTDMDPSPTSFWLISSTPELATVLISLLLSVCRTTYLLSRQWDGAQTPAGFFCFFLCVLIAKFVFFTSRLTDGLLGKYLFINLSGELEKIQYLELLTLN